MKIVLQCWCVVQHPKKPLSKNNSIDSIRRESASVGTTDGSQRNGVLSPKSAMRMYSDRLTDYEQQELLSFAQIYFVGSAAKKSDAVQSGENNDGFDDSHNAYIIIAHDHIAYRYEILKSLGKGSFGQVLTFNICSISRCKNQLHLLSMQCHCCLY